MAKTIRYSLMVAAVLGMIALSTALSSAVAVAQDNGAQSTSAQPAPPGQPAEDPGARSHTDAAFDHYLRQNPEVRQQVMKNPSLLNNQDYLAKHPDLQKFMQDHPDFAKATAKNPERIMHKSAAHEKQASARREARRPEQKK